MKTRIIVIAAALVAFMASESLAQKNMDKAREIFRGGQTAYKAGQYKVAAQAFEQALKVYPVPAIVFSTAQAHRLQYFIDKDPGRLKRAIQLYRQYIKSVSKGGRRDDAVASLAELEPILQRMEASKAAPIKAVTVETRITQLMVSAQVQGAKAYIDGKPGNVPLIRKVKPGTHKVKVEAPGYFTEERTATAVDGQFVSIEIKLRPKPAVVKVSVKSGAAISVDGRLVGMAPLARPLELTQGKHFISITRRGYQSFAREVNVKRGQTMDMKVRLKKTTQRKLAFWVTVTAGVGFGLTTVAGISMLGANSDAKTLEDKRQSEGLTPAELDDYLDAKQRRSDERRNTLVLLGISSAIGISGLLMYLLDNPRAEVPLSGFGGDSNATGERKPLAVTPMVGNDLAGLSVMGRF